MNPNGYYGYQEKEEKGHWARRRFERRSSPTSGLGFHAQIFWMFAVLIILTLVVLVICLSTSKHARQRRFPYHGQRGRSNDLTNLYRHSLTDDIGDIDDSSLAELDSALLRLDEFGSEDKERHVSSIHEDSTETSFNPDPCEKERFNNEEISSFVLLFTFIPTTISDIDLKYAVSNVKLWSELDPHIRVVLYLPANLNKTQINHIKNECCPVKRLTLERIDTLVLKSHATMRTLFETSYSKYNATWYGYAEYGTLFDVLLYVALRSIYMCRNITAKGNLILGRSHSIQLQDWDAAITQELDMDTVLEHIQSFTVIDETILGNGIHYYFTTRYGFPWHRIPSLIPESEYLDAFLMWYTMKNTSIAAVDATDAIFSLHQGGLNLTDTVLSSNKAVRIYNEMTITKAKYPMYYKKGLGVIKCLEYALTNQNSPYFVLSRNTRKYIRRVTKGKSQTIDYYCRITDTANVQLVDGIYNFIKNGVQEVELKSNSKRFKL